MKNAICLFLCLFLASVSLLAQDEGTIVKRERIQRDKGIFLGLGPSFTLGKNIGDYSEGFNFELGFQKRLNRVLSIGPSISYVEFAYDPAKTGLNNIFISEERYMDDFGDLYAAGAVIDFEGGDISLTSLAVTVKVNFVPIKDNSKFSVYAFAKPFISSVSRTAVKGTATFYGNYGDVSNPEDWTEAFTIPYEDNADWGIDLSESLDGGDEVTGGVFVGPGIEFMPAKAVSIFAQASFGYTFPVTFVSTSAYSNESFESLAADFPLIKKGFPSVSIQIGGSFNF